MADEYEYKDPNTDMMKALSKAVDAATGETGTQYEYKNPNTDVIQKLEELTEAIATSGGGGGGGSSTLSGLTDVDLNSPTNGQVLGYNGTDWTNTTVGNASKQELTWSQYQQLSEEQKNNGTMYFCTDVNGDGSQFQPVIYSTEEREIGVWTDGKPLYQKSINYTLSSVSDWTILDNSVSYDTLVFISGTSSTSAEIRAFGNTYQSEPRFIVKGTDNALYYYTTNAFYGYVTIQYTKTTDTAGSGTWTPQGIPAVHYSTDEQVVGTWIDGSTLYEKTLNVGTIGTSTTFAHGISNLDEIIDYKGFGMYAGSKAIMPYQNPLVGSGFGINTYDSTNIAFMRSTNLGSDFTDCYVTIRYTKSAS